MPVKSKTVEDVLSRRRLMIVGPPNAAKTTCALTFDHPLLVESMPGEKGTDILPPADNRVIRLWEPIKPDDPVDWFKVMKEMEQEQVDVLSGKLGKFQTVFLDGIHKGFQVFLEAAMESSKGQSGEPNGLIYWNKAAQDFSRYFNRWWYSSIPYFAATVWSEIEKTDPLAEDTLKNRAARSIWPSFAGKTQRNILGEINTVYADVEAGKATWQLKADERIKGIGIKLPLEEAQKLPYKIPADWQVLKKLLLPTQ